ncbi:2-keto-4-pentenoate hydratase [Cytobacillus sp. FSL R5-0569]|uniref:2-keto-4-pentenoate hydratase n=1 Tax=unclassified Cytobacillus TaxID=2675268 RepID=UPI0030F96311
MSVYNDVEIKRFSDSLLRAERNGIGVPPITTMHSGIKIHDAYKIQLKTIEQKVKEGEKVVGKKIGLTSKAMQELLGVNQPDYGHLMDGMTVPNLGTIQWEKVIKPKVEAEIAFILKNEIKGPNITNKDVIEATDYILPALEIVDSRNDWKITIQDTIADNASSGLYILGDRKFDISEIDLINEEVTLYKNEVIMNKGVGSASLGNPVTSVAWLANTLHEYGVALEAGEVILSGALSAAIEANKGDNFKASFANLGEVKVSFSI